MSEENNSELLVDVLQQVHSDASMDGVAGVSGETSSDEPPAKQPRLDDEADNYEQSIKRILHNINKAILMRLDSIEKKIEHVNTTCRILEDKVEHITSQVKNSAIWISMQKNKVTSPHSSGAVIVGLPQSSSTPRISSNQSDSDSGQGASGDPGNFGYQSLSPQFGPNVTLITLNTEEDYPSGSWLGDENNLEMRVRCHISSTDLEHVNKTCNTAERMALTLLDYLFDRETQAQSNISGMGKHSKKQLDPLMIYGIRCHLIHKFGITEKDWHRIKQNMDSKCRSAFRRKQRGLPLTVKAFRDKTATTYLQIRPSGDMSDDSMQHDSDTAELTIRQPIGEMTHAIAIQPETDQHEVTVAMTAMGQTQVIQTQHGPIQVLTATPEQIAQIQQGHQIQILTGDQVIHEVHEATEDDLTDQQEQTTTAAALVTTTP